MSKQCGPLLLIICAVVAVSGVYASTIQDSAIRHAPTFYGAAALQMPSTTDNWLGGSGYWSDQNWSAGVPGADSDVVIYSGGSDNVLLDTNASIASLTLGGTSGGSELDSTARP